VKIETEIPEPDKDLEVEDTNIICKKGTGRLPPDCYIQLYKICKAPRRRMSQRCLSE
jgi:hypothetical protein